MSKLLKYIIFLILINNLIAHDCLILNSNHYGDCSTPLGYSWTGNGCSSSISGCSYINEITGEDDSSAFFPSYEQCISFCFQHTGVVGDLNEDFERGQYRFCFDEMPYVIRSSSRFCTSYIL